MTEALQNPERLTAIANLGLDDPDLKRRLDALVAQVAEQLGFEVGLVSVVLGDAQWFVGEHGLSGWLAQVKGTPLEWSFCAHVATSGKALSVADAQLDDRFRDNPLVRHEGIRCYHGVPLITRGGTPLGSLCVIGSESHALPETAQVQLRRFADEVMATIEGDAKTDLE